jgi:uncharacterized protein DUF4157
MLTRPARSAKSLTAPDSATARRFGKPRPALASSHSEKPHETTPSATHAPGFDFARINLSPNPPGPAVSDPSDTFEQEADRVASNKLRSDAVAKPAIQSSPQSPARNTAPPDTRAAVHAASHGGTPMPKDLLSYFQPRFGHDFSKARLHTGSEAADGARSIQARAYTTGRDIVFGAGQYTPDTVSGKQLLAHELTHVVQQDRTPGSQPNVLMREPTQSPPSPPLSPLEQLSDTEKQKLQFDTDTVASPPALSSFFGLPGTPNLATNVDSDFEFDTPAIDALKDDKIKTGLYRGLRLFALSTFDLLPGADSKAHSKRLNLVHVENLDLTRYGGPNASFRFSCIGSESKGKITVKILIEAIGAPAKPMADPAATPDIEKRKATPYGLKHDSSVSEALWQRVLGALGAVDESLIMRIRDVTFVTSSQQVGSDGEAASFDFKFSTGPWTKKIILFQKIINANDADFARLFAHELGHAIDFAPAEKPGGRIAKGEAHNLPKFQEAARKDGGRAKAITDYGKTSDLEFFSECLSLFVQQPDTFRALRPNIYNYFVTYEWAAVKDPNLNAPSTVWSTAPKKNP